MIRFMSLIAALLMTTGPVMALSCYPADATDYFWQAQQSPDRYIVVHGTVSVRSEPTPSHRSPDRKGITYRGTFSGKQATKSGFKTVEDFDVIVRVTCVASWCGGPVSGQPVLAFLKKTRSGYELLSSPCNDLLVRNPSGADLRSVDRCMVNPSRCAP